MRTQSLPAQPLQPEQPDLLAPFLSHLEQVHGPEAREAAAAMLGRSGLVPSEPGLLREIKTFTAAWLEQRGVIPPPRPEVRVV